MKNKRYAGILMPVSSLPSPYGIGTLGRDAKNFIDFLSESGQKIWQVLPLVPTGYGDSPYASTCSTAGSPYLIDVETLKNQGLLTHDECEKYDCEQGERVNYELLFKRRIPLLKIAFSRFNIEDKGFLKFIKNGEYSDFSLFMALKEFFHWKAFCLWPEKYRKKDKIAIEEFENSHKNEILFWQFTQYQFFSEWKNLKEYANKKGIMIMGDMPLYVSDDSVEVWAHPELFMLDEKGAFAEVAGVPPDYFSEDGQLWGNPLYNWQNMKKDGYSWWNKRLIKAFEMYDYVRIDHFRGFDRFYAIPYGDKNARNGRWCPGPKEDLFKDKLNFNIIAEDLGIIDEGVERLMKNVGYPGMKILEFAFEGDSQHPYKPSNLNENCVVYTGTHDNSTFNEYIENLSKRQKRIFYGDVKNECAKFGITIKKMSKDIARKAVIKMAYMSKARFVILPLQDVCGIGKEGHFNHPGLLGSFNWGWRANKKLFKAQVSSTLKSLAESTSR